MNREEIEARAMMLSTPDEKCWVNWRYEERTDKKTGAKKLTKVPYMPDGITKADSTDAATWSTFAEVEAVRAQFDGIGYVFAGDVLGVDLDHVFEGDVPPYALEFIEKSDTYTELSPSRTGAHVYFKLSEPLTLEANRKKIGKYHKDEGYECYTEKRFFTFTGETHGELKSVRTITAQEAIELLRLLGYPWKKELARPVHHAPTKSVSLGDYEVLEKMFASKNGASIRALYDGDTSKYANDDSSADAALCAHLAYWTGKDAVQMERLWLASPLGSRSKTQERKGYRATTINFAIENCTDVYSPSGSEKPENELTQTQKILELVADNSGLELFRDEYDIAHVRLTVGDHKETWQCNSRKFRLWLTQAFYEQHGAVVQPSVIAAAVQAIEAKAVFKGGEHKLNNRVARVGDTIWYDLGDKRNRAIRITANGWEIAAEPPTLFRRHTHQEEQVEPVSGGSVSELLRFVNVSDEAQQLLLLVYLVSCFIPGFPHPILYVYGQQGSAKSTLWKLMRRLTDPSRTEVLSMPKETREMALQLSRHHLLVYENVSFIPHAISDMLCIGVTGGSISERAYFTNGEDFIFNILTNIGINGINISAIQPDLLERSILMELRPISDKNRRDEQKLYAEFEAARPAILGAIFDAVVKALKTRESVKLESLTRMADFVLWGCAIAEALGYTRQQFLDAYGRKVREQKEESLASSIEAQLLIAFMADKEEWSGTASRLLKELEDVAIGQGEPAKGLPSQPNALTRRLNALKPNLITVGLGVAVSKAKGVRNITIEKIEADKTDDASEKTAPEVSQNAPDVVAQDDAGDVAW